MDLSDIHESICKGGESSEPQNPGQQRNVLWKTYPGRPDNFTGTHFLQRLVLSSMHSC